MGDSLTYFILANVLFNFTVMFFVEIKYVKRVCRKRYHDKKVKKILKMRRLYREQQEWIAEHEPEKLVVMDIEEESKDSVAMRDIPNPFNQTRLIEDQSIIEVDS